jgi:hypothetical protein
MSVRPDFITLTPADANLTGFASNVTGATWTLTTTATTDSLAHRVSIRNDSGTDHSLKTMILTGTDADGRAQTETALNMPAGGATVESTKYFKTLTSIVPSATIGVDTMDIGWVDEFISKTVPFNWRGKKVTIQVDVTGTINYTAQFSNSDIQRDTTFVWHDSNDSNVVSATTDQASNYEFPVMATRVKANSYSSGAIMKYIIIQNDI